jgi:hypothetical protein
VRKRITATAVYSMVAVARRTHSVARPPATVVTTVGFIVIHAYTDAAVIAVTAAGDDAAGRQSREKPDNKGNYRPAEV